MSDEVARTILTRLHQREMAMSPLYTGFENDMRALAAHQMVSNRQTLEEILVQRREELVATYGLTPTQQTKPFAFSNGIAIIPVHGTLVNRFSYSWGYVTGYNFIRQQTAAAGQDPEVLGIIYDHQSYGGEAAGCFECSAELPNLANGKPTIAIVDSACYSGAYALAVNADKIICTPSGGVGSVGVVAMHISVEKALNDFGVKITFIHAGAHKVDGNPFEDLPESVKADIQKSIDKSYTAFVAVVAKGRGMDEKAVRATEARTYRADDALSLGLIDAVASPNEAVQAFLSELSGSKPQPRKKEDVMSDDKTKPAAETQASPEQIRQAQADAVKADRARVAAITGCEEAKGREDLAQHLALETDMSADAAKVLLAKSPKADAKGNPFKATMDASDHPKVGANDGPESAAGATGQEPTASDVAKRVIANASLAGVRGFAAKKTA